MAIENVATLIWRSVGLFTVLAILPALPVVGHDDAFAQEAEKQHETEIQAILVHPPFAQSYSCAEHWDGQLQYPGDSLGADCTIGRLVEEDGRKWMRTYQGDGRQNEDWFGWEANVLAPCDCTVANVYINPETNPPGVLGKPPASSITFERADGIRILYAHIATPQVAVGDVVHAGDVVAKVGNNGYGRQPHIHIGAWRGKIAFQLRFDQTKMGPNAGS